MYFSISEYMSTCTSSLHTCAGAIDAELRKSTKLSYIFIYTYFIHISTHKHICI